MGAKVLYLLLVTLLSVFSPVSTQAVTCNIEATDAYGHEVLGFRFIKGLSYTLTCSCQNLNEAIDYYQWSKNDSSLFGEVRSTLSLSLLKLSDAGRYTCSATLSDVHYTSSIDIIIQIPAPSYVIVRSNKRNPIRPVGSNVILTCIVEIPQSTVHTTVPLVVSIHLTTPAGVMLNTTTYSVSGPAYTSTAIIESFQRAQSGVYACEATLTSPSAHLSESSTLTEEINLSSGVYLSLGGAVNLLNNTCASISEIGSSPPHQLACVSEKTPCCQNEGQWYYPNGSQVRGRSSDQNSYYVERTNEGSVNLFRYNDTLEPHGKFCCKIADNSDATYTACIDLVPPVSILIDDKGVTPVAGLNHSLVCKVSGIDTTMMYTWKKGDAPLSEVGPTLSFSPLRLSDAGQYLCAISVHDCPFKRMKNLTIEQVFQPVSVTLISDPISPLGVAGSNVTVMCTAELNSAIDVPVNIQIRLTGPDGGALATTNGTPRPRSMANYTINSFRREQIGVYTCTVNLSSPRLQGRVITKTIHIHVGVQLVLKGTIYRNNSLFFLNELGRTIESDDALQCITDKAECCKRPPNRFGEWYFPNGSLIPVEYRGDTGFARVFYRNRGDDGTVNLNRAIYEDIPPSGHYCCEVPNAADVYQTVCANILLGARIGENTAPQIGLNDYALTCTISGTVNRNVTYRWIKDSSTRIWNSTGTNSSILSFASPLKLSDAGNYTCEVLIPRESPSLANSVMVRAEASWVVTMEIPPLTDVSIVSDPPSPIRPIGARVRLNCSYDTASSLPSEYTDVDIVVRFSLTDATGRRLTTTAPTVFGSVYSSSAVINSFQWDQSGLYNCQVDVSTRSSFTVGAGKSTMKRITVGVYLSIGGRIIPSNRTIIITDIGTSSPNQLICTSDKKPCCQGQRGWYFPNRSRVAYTSEHTAFNSDRNSWGEISLYRTSTNVKSPVGQFCCETIDATNTNHTLCITVSPPIIANITAEGTARVGQPYTLVCSVLSGLEGLNAVVSYQWTKDNGTRSHLGANSNTLLFPSLRLSDAGLYTCEIMVNSSRLLKQATIRTATQVKVSIPQPSIDVISSAPNPILTGSSPTLLCIVELHPAVNVPVNLNFVWISPHDSTLMSTLVTKSSSLYINKVVLSDISLEDAGQYTCKATIGSEAIIGSDISVSAQRDVEIGDGMFQLRLKYTNDCREWHKSSLGEMEMYKHFIEEALIEAIKLRCECYFPQENLLQESFSCSSSPHLTTYRNTLVGTHNVNASQLIVFIQDWVNSGPRVTIKGSYSVWVDKKCPVAVSSFDEPECGEE